MQKPILTVAVTKRKGGDWSVSSGDPVSKDPAEPLFPSHDEPQLVVRLMASVYQTEPIKVLRGPTALAQIGAGCCLIAHPQPYDSSGALTAECRSFLIGAVRNAVTATRFRMCLVWSPTSCVFVEMDGSVKVSAEPPSGGFPIPFRTTFDADRVPLDQSQGEA